MKRESGRRGIYLLPNLFTTAALFAGFFAVVAARNNRFEAAAVSIFVAMILDGMDGRIARMTNTQSDFGAEYDSLSDMLSFGLAPALVVYEWCLYLFGKFGWLAAFFYVAMAALRLARFNTTIGIADKRYFQGLPSPAAAALLAGVVWLGHDAGLQNNKGMHLAALLATLTAAALMVSKMRYFSFKEINLRGRIPFVTVLAIVLGFVLVSLDPSSVLLAMFAVYAASGPMITLTLIRRRRAERRAAKLGR